MLANFLPLPVDFWTRREQTLYISVYLVLRAFTIACFRKHGKDSC